MDYRYFALLLIQVYGNHPAKIECHMEAGKGGKQVFHEILLG